MKTCKEFKKELNELIDKYLCDECHEEEQEITNERGYLVYKQGEKPKEHLVFVEFRHGKALFSDYADLGMVFTFKGMAEHIAEKLGKGWEVLDLDKVYEESASAKRLLAILFRDDDDEDEEDENEDKE